MRETSPAGQGDRPLELRVGGTRPDDVRALRQSLARMLAARGLLDPGTGPGADGTGEGAGGSRPLLVPIGPEEDPEAVSRDLAGRLAPVPPAADLLLRTSGSTTGTGSLVAMSARALVASARATETRLAGPGAWVLALPAHHVAGLQVLVRSAVAGTEPVVVDISAGFRPAALADGVGRALASAPGRPVYVSLVPTQLVRVLDDAPSATALSAASAVLIGGAAADARLLDRARAAGIAVVTTYGMSETGGGCVYDGVPLDGVRVRIEDPDESGAGRILIAGPVLAEGYSHRPAPGQESVWRAGAARHARRAHRSVTGGELELELATSDLGRFDAQGRLVVLGRVDDVIVTGGIKVDPHEVEAVLASLPGVAQACVVGAPDPQWGAAVVAAVVPRAGVDLEAGAIRRQARERLEGARAPKRVRVLNELPLRGPGKVDRRALAELLAGA